MHKGFAYCGPVTAGDILHVSRELKVSTRSLWIGDFLKHWRTKRSIKLQTAAQELGVATSTWDHWETGRRSPSLDNLIAVADYLQIPPQCMLCAKKWDCTKEGGRRRCDD